jgi:hypothetical protein
VAVVVTRQNNIGWPLSGKSYRLLSGKSYRLYSPPRARSTSDRQRSARPKKIGAEAEMLAPAERGSTTPVPGPLRRTLLGTIIVIGAMAIGAVILWAVTEWLWLVVHEGLR